VGNQEVTVTVEPDGPWSAKYRPLNAYLYNAELTGEEAKDVRLFHCPSDKGYPDHPNIVDAPRSAADIPCYDLLGNSYRINPAGFFWGGMGSYSGAFSVGSLGHGVATIPEPGQVVLYTESLFYSMSVPGWSPYDAPLIGWHGRIMEEDVAYVDGSARPTRAGELVEWTDQLMDDMGVGSCGIGRDGLLRRGRTWRTDTYPAPGARIHCYDPSGRDRTGTLGSECGRSWPGRGHTEVAQWWR